MGYIGLDCFIMSQGYVTKEFGKTCKSYVIYKTDTWFIGFWEFLGCLMRLSLFLFTEDMRFEDEKDFLKQNASVSL